MPRCGCSPERGIAVCVLTNGDNGGTLNDRLLVEVLARRRGRRDAVSTGTRPRRGAHQARAPRGHLPASRHRLRRRCGRRRDVDHLPTRLRARGGRRRAGRPSRCCRSTARATASSGAPPPPRSGSRFTFGEIAGRPGPGHLLWTDHPARVTIRAAVRRDRCVRSPVRAGRMHGTCASWWCRTSTTGCRTTTGWSRRAADVDVVVVAGRPGRRRQPGSPRRPDRGAHAKYLTMLSEQPPVLVASGNHDLDGPGRPRRAGRELAAARVDPRDLHVDGYERRHRRTPGSPSARGGTARSPVTQVAAQLAAAAIDRPARWVWPYHAPPGRYPAVPRRHGATFPDHDLAELDRRAPARLRAVRSHPPGAVGGRRFLASPGSARPGSSTPGKQIGQVPAAHHPRHRGRYGATGSACIDGGPALSTAGASRRAVCCWSPSGYGAGRQVGAEGQQVRHPSSLGHPARGPLRLTFRGAPGAALS